MGAPGSEAEGDAAPISASVKDPRRFGVIFARHAEAVHRYLSRRLEPSAVDDALSETFVTAFRSRHRYDPAYADARPWLFGIATNVVHHHRRAEGRRRAMVARVTQLIAGEQATEPAPDEVAGPHERQDELDRLQSVLSQVDEKYLDVLMLFTGPQLSYDEIARALEVPVGTVRSRMSRGRAQLRELLLAAGQYLDDGTPIAQRAHAEEPRS
ncbi:MAG TPA: RNA polymerase sigma factor [Acidimicrobiales bacterium]|jgi:RNA polymerase sigma-70 factor (ECF subfamily)